MYLSRHLRPVVQGTLRRSAFSIYPLAVEPLCILSARKLHLCAWSSLFLFHLVLPLLSRLFFFYYYNYNCYYKLQHHNKELTSAC